MNPRRLHPRHREELAKLFGGCPDCNADSTLIDLSPGVYQLVVSHDSTCPNFAHIQATRPR